MDILTALRPEERKIEKELGVATGKTGLHRNYGCRYEPLRNPEVGWEFAMGKKRMYRRLRRARLGEGIAGANGPEYERKRRGLVT